MGAGPYSQAAPPLTRKEHLWWAWQYTKRANSWWLIKIALLHFGHAITLKRKPNAR